jgi:hypothetical protein
MNTIVPDFIYIAALLILFISSYFLLLLSELYWMNQKEQEDLDVNKKQMNIYKSIFNLFIDKLVVLINSFFYLFYDCSLTK